MDTHVEFEVARLQRMTPKQLRQRYVEAFGEEPASRNKVWLLRRIAWRIQARAEGGLSERARRRASGLANDADLRMNPPFPRQGDPAPGTTRTETAAFRPDGRVPPPGTVLTREYKGRTVQVRVLPRGFEYEGKVLTVPVLGAVPFTAVVRPKKRRSAGSEASRHGSGAG